MKKYEAIVAIYPDGIEGEPVKAYSADFDTIEECEKFIFEGDAQNAVIREYDSATGDVDFGAYSLPYTQGTYYAGYTIIRNSDREIVDSDEDFELYY